MDSLRLIHPTCNCLNCSGYFFKCSDRLSASLLGGCHCFEYASSRMMRSKTKNVFTNNRTFALHKKKLYLYSFNMKVLGIETSGLVGNIAVCDGNTVVGKKTYGKSFSHGKEIVSSLESIFNEIKWQPNDIDLIAVSIGLALIPGSE